MSFNELVNLFASSPPGAIPHGFGRGVALIGAGASLSGAFAAGTRLFGWQGKTFDAARGRLVNHITPFGLQAIVADVYIGPSWLDGKDCVVLDYSKTSTIAHFIRDEIRNVALNGYLGFAYLGRLRTIGFALDFSS